MASQSQGQAAAAAAPSERVILEALLDRVYSAVGKGTVYSLGAGAPFLAPLPADERGGCDCSGFVAWAFQYHRYQPLYAWLRRLNGGWMNTDGIVEDTKQPTGLWAPDAQRNVGSVLVYPGRPYAITQQSPGTWGMPKIGHVGVITRRVATGYRVVHCSLGNWQKAGDAIRETNSDVFDKVPYTVCARFASLEIA